MFTKENSFIKEKAKHLSNFLMSISDKEYHFKINFFCNYIDAFILAMDPCKKDEYKQKIINTLNLKMTEEQECIFNQYIEMFLEINKTLPRKKNINNIL